MAELLNFLDNISHGHNTYNFAFSTLIVLGFLTELVICAEIFLQK